MSQNEFANNAGDEAWVFGFRFTIEPPRRTARVPCLAASAAPRAPVAQATADPDTAGTG